MTKVGILCEGCELKVNIEAIHKSRILVDLFERTTISSQIKIDNISLPILRKILEFCEQHTHSTSLAIIRPLQSRAFTENGFDLWDTHFIELDSMQDLVDMTVCADFLEIDELVVLCCAKIASLAKHIIPTVSCAKSASTAFAFELESPF